MVVLEVVEVEVLVVVVVVVLVEVVEVEVVVVGRLVVVGVVGVEAALDDASTPHPPMASAKTAATTASGRTIGVTIGRDAPDAGAVTSVVDELGTERRP